MKTDAIENLIEWHTDRLGLELRAQAKQARDQLEGLKAAAADTDILRADRDRTQENYLKVVARLSALEAEAEASRLALRAARNQIGCNCHVEPVGFMCTFCANAIDFIDAALARDKKEIAK